MGVRRIVVPVIALALGGCGGAAPAKLASTTTTTAPSTPTAPPPKPTPKPKAAPHAKRSHVQPQAPASDSQTVATVTSDGSVLVLDNGDVYSTSEDASNWENETANVSEDESKITKADNGEQLEVSKVGDTSSDGPYAGAGQEHNQDTNSSDGAILVLEDGSVWKVADADQSTASTWPDASAISVSEEESGSEYTLRNTDENESVTASYLGDK